MYLIETCPKCGHDLLDITICTMPPIQRKECPGCGWNWEGKPDEIKRVPFVKFPESSPDWGTIMFPIEN